MVSAWFLTKRPYKVCWPLPQPTCSAHRVSVERRQRRSEAVKNKPQCRKNSLPQKGASLRARCGRPEAQSGLGEAQPCKKWQSISRCCGRRAAPELGGSGEVMDRPFSVLDRHGMLVFLPQTPFSPFSAQDVTFWPTSTRASRDPARIITWASTSDFMRFRRTAFGRLWLCAVAVLSPDSHPWDESYLIIFT